MSNKNAVALHSPPTRAAVALFTTMKAIVDQLMLTAPRSNYVAHLARESDRQTFFSSLHRLSEKFRLFVRRITLEAHDGEILTFLLKALEEAETNLDAAKATLAKFTKEELQNLKVNNAPAEPERVFGAALLELAAQLQAVTPEQIAMESHYLKLVRGDVAFTSGEEFRLFAPLTVLRDRYFTAPTIGDLQEYLQLSERVVTDAGYERYRKALFVAGRIDNAADLRADLAPLTVELEVLSMLEPITGEESVRSHRG